MNQPTGERIRRGMNFLSMLGVKLRDLQGTATLAHELIQNAEDAVGKKISKLVGEGKPQKPLLNAGGPDTITDVEPRAARRARRHRGVPVGTHPRRDAHAYGRPDLPGRGSRPQAPGSRRLTAGAALQPRPGGVTPGGTL